MWQESSTTLDFSAARNDYVAKLQLAPVIDLVLFLIWFYLLVGQLVVSQKDADVELPQMNSAVAGQELPAEIVINLREDGRVVVSGQDVRGAALEQLLARELDKAHKEGGDLRVVVRADRRQSFAGLDEVLKACRRSGMKQIVFRAVEGGAP
jgi:biopolymer transport protein ExbD